MKKLFIISVAYIVTINDVLVQTRDGLYYSHDIEYLEYYQQYKNESMLEIVVIYSHLKSYKTPTFKY